MPWLVATNLFRGLQQARHSIKTGYDVSQPVCGNKDEDKPIAGIGQGNGLGFSLWCLFNTIIIKPYKRKGHGTIITTPISKKEVFLLGFVFVGDADLVTVANNAYTSDVEMIQKIQALMTDGAVIFKPLAISSPLLKLDGSWCYFSRMAPTGSTKQKTHSLVSQLYLIKTETCTLSPEKSLQQSLNLLVYVTNTLSSTHLLCLPCLKK